MARIRSIHPDACKSEKLDMASAEAERCYWRLQPQCDDDGRAEDDPRLLRSAMFPLSETITPGQVDDWLAELETKGLIVRYVVDDKGYLAVTKFRDYQKPQHPQASKLPPVPDDHAPSHNVTGSIPEHPHERSGALMNAHEGFSQSLRGVGVGVGEGVGVIAPAKRARDEVFDALCLETGINPAELTPIARGGLNRSVKELKQVGATPGEIGHRRAALSKRYPTIKVTPTMLAKHWASLGNGSTAVSTRTLEQDQAEWAKLTADDPWATP